MAQHEAVLFANDAFYLAFQGRDVDGMNDIWAEDVAVSCIHPGWHALHDRDEIMESWESIMANDSSPDIRCRDARASVYGGTATVICFEEIGGDYLIATNVFHQEMGRWRLVHHQAAPTNGAPDDDPDTQPQTMN
jgi:ketosteroid isomerase-like protein